MTEKITHEQFIDALVLSQTPVKVAANWLRELGYYVRMPEMKIAPTRENNFKYRDSGDLWLSINGVQMRVEVKHRKNLNFTCCEDYPFETIFIDEQYTIQKPGKLWAYMILNKDMTYAAVVLSETSRHWVVEEKEDPRQDRPCKFCVCPKSKALFLKVLGPYV